MRLGHLAATASALMLMASPALAATANPASKLSVASAQSVRGGSNLKKSSGIAPVVVVVAVLVALTGLGFATGVIGDDDDSDSD